MHKVNFKEIYDHISKSENIVSIEPISGFEICWRLNYSFLHDEERVEIPLDISIDSKFPNSFPKIFLPKDFIQKWGYLPHVDLDSKNSRNFICTFYTDEAVIVLGREIYFFEILINKAKKILREGISKKNENDFDEEFLAYWTREYYQSQIFSCSIFLYGELLNNSHVDFFSSPNDKCVICHVFGNKGIEGKTVKKNLDKNFIKSSNLLGFYYGEFPHKLKPPFDFRIDDIVQIIIDNPSAAHEVEKLYNKNFLKKICLIFSKKINNTFIYFGLNFPQCYNSDGFRSPFKWLKSQSSFMERTIFRHLTNNKLSIRSKGVIDKNEKKIAVLGCGSVGSVIIDALVEEGYNNITLVDNDNFRTENLKRHVLNINDFGVLKTEGIKNRLTLLNPFLNIDVYNKDAVEFLDEQSAKYDFVFIVIGNEIVERQIRERVYEKKLGVPVVFIWIEPYCVGGHCVFMNACSLDIEQKLFRDNLFVFNVIDNEEYIKDNDNLLKSEAGCQGVYVPYSYKLIKQFVYSICDEIFNLVENSNSDTVKVFSWVGEIEKIKEMNLKISDTFNEKSKYFIKEWDVGEPV